MYFTRSVNLLVTAALVAAQDGFLKMGFDVLKGDSLPSALQDYARSHHHRLGHHYKKDGSEFLLYELANADNFYVAKISVGTPGQELSVVLDTGSSDLWITASSNPNCAANGGTINCAEYGSFDYTESSTFNNAGTALDITYIDGTNSKGYWASDSVAFGTSSAISNVTFGVANVTDSSAGVCGISFPILQRNPTKYDNLPTLLKKQGVIKSESFSLYLTSETAETGSILFGAYDNAKFEGTLEDIPIPKVATSKGDMVYAYLWIPLDSITFKIGNTTTPSTSSTISSIASSSTSSSAVASSAAPSSTLSSSVEPSSSSTVSSSTFSSAASLSLTSTASSIAESSQVVSSSSLLISSIESSSSSISAPTSSSAASSSAASSSATSSSVLSSSVLSSSATSSSTTSSSATSSSVFSSSATSSSTTSSTVTSSTVALSSATSSTVPSSTVASSTAIPVSSSQQSSSSSETSQAETSSNAISSSSSSVLPSSSIVLSSTLLTSSVAPTTESSSSSAPSSSSVSTSSTTILSSLSILVTSSSTAPSSSSVITSSSATPISSSEPTSSSAQTSLSSLKVSSSEVQSSSTEPTSSSTTLSLSSVAVPSSSSSTSEPSSTVQSSSSDKPSSIIPSSTSKTSSIQTSSTLKTSSTIKTSSTTSFKSSTIISSTTTKTTSTTTKATPTPTPTPTEIPQSPGCASYDIWCNIWSNAGFASQKPTSAINNIVKQIQSLLNRIQQAFNSIFGIFGIKNTRKGHKREFDIFTNDNVEKRESSRSYEEVNPKSAREEVHKRADSDSNTIEVSSTSFILDSGTTYSYLPDELNKQIALKLDPNASIQGNGMYKVDCSLMVDDNYLVFTFQSKDIQVPLTRLITQSGLTCSLGFVSSATPIFGDNFLRSCYTLFNLDSKTISIAQINYTDDEDIQVIQ